MNPPTKPHPVVTMRDGIRFYDMPGLGYRQILEVPEYRFGDILQEDIVIDIGANAGAFSIRAAFRSGNVHAVEPVTTGILRENIPLNGVHVTVHELALGMGGFAVVCWDNEQKRVETATLGEIISRAGGCDFLKCDCEGAEWHIDPRDLDGIRRLEMELHLPPIGGAPEPRLLDYIARNYEYEVTRVPSHGPLGLLGYLHATRKPR